MLHHLLAGILKPTYPSSVEISPCEQFIIIVSVLLLSSSSLQRSTYLTTFLCQGPWEDHCLWAVWACSWEEKECSVCEWCCSACCWPSPPPVEVSWYGRRCVISHLCTNREHCHVEWDRSFCLPTISASSEVAEVCIPRTKLCLSHRQKMCAWPAS